MEKDILIIRREPAANTTGWKPITISTELYEMIKGVADDSGMSMSKVACLILEFGLDRVVIKGMGER